MYIPSNSFVWSNAPLGGGGYNYQIEISAKYSDTRIIGHSDEFTGESPTFYKSVVS